MIQKKDIIGPVLAMGWFFAAASSGYGGGEDMSATIRKADGKGGRWFSSNGVDLASEVGGYIKKAKPEKVEGRIVGGIAPHAGYMYSGPVAGYTFRAIKDSLTGTNLPETVVVLGFTHGERYEGVALMDGDAVETPIGKTALDRAGMEILMKKSSRIFARYSPHIREHSAENELPFVQSAVPGAKLIVGLIGDHDMKTIDEVAGALSELAGRKKIVVVASTDLLHDADYDLVTKTDKETLKKIAAMDFDGVARSWAPGAQVCCGIAPVLTVMKFAKLQGCETGTVLHYRNSGDDFPESRGSWVVGYGSVVFSTEKK